MDDLKATKKCILHIVGNNEHAGDTIVLFTEQTWKTVSDIAEARKQYQRYSKYLDICNYIDFNSELLPTYGYHSSCYSKFTAFHKQSPTEETSESNACSKTRSMKECPVPSTRTGVLEKMCIFCKERSRKHFQSGLEYLSFCETKEAEDKLINAAKQQGDSYFFTKI